MSVRLDCLAIFTMAAVSGFAVFVKDKADPVMLSLMVTYSLNMPWMLIRVVHSIQHLESQFVSVDRLFKLMEIPQEN